MFNRGHHQRIAWLLNRLDASLLLRTRCLFGGGTAIVLTHGEYRESVDIDFICDDINGYRELRSLVHGQGIQSMLLENIPLVREPRVDQYGIRCALRVGDIPIKLEIIFEGRIHLSEPTPANNICGVPTLAPEDQAATKLMANSDRWADDSVMGRDIIDLAMLTDSGQLPTAGVSKAIHAYGTSVLDDLDKAKRHLLDREGRLRYCMRALSINTAESVLRERLEQLSAVLPPLS